MAESSDEQLGEVMTVVSYRLVELQYFEMPQPASAETSGLPASDSAGLLHYQFTAYYETGAAEVDLVLHELRDASSRYSFNIQIPN